MTKQQVTNPTAVEALAKYVVIPDWCLWCGQHASDMRPLHDVRLGASRVVPMHSECVDEAQAFTVAPPMPTTPRELRVASTLTGWTVFVNEAVKGWVRQESASVFTSSKRGMEYVKPTLHATLDDAVDAIVNEATLRDDAR